MLLKNEQWLQSRELGEFRRDTVDSKMKMSAK